MYEFDRCGCCGGYVPPQELWGAEGEREDGECPGAVNPDGMCGAFGARSNYASELGLVTQ